LNDARLLDWLEATRSALEAPAHERIASLQQAHRRRSELMQSLTDSPAQAPDQALREQLEQAEQALQALVKDLPEQIQRDLVELRRVRSGARGYLPSMPNDPTLVSREV